MTLNLNEMKAVRDALDNGMPTEQSRRDLLATIWYKLDKEIKSQEQHKKWLKENGIKKVVKSSKK